MKSIQDILFWSILSFLKLTGLWPQREGLLVREDCLGNTWIVYKPSESFVNFSSTPIHENISYSWKIVSKVNFCTLPQPDLFEGRRQPLGVTNPATACLPGDSSLTSPSHHRSSMHMKMIETHRTRNMAWKETVFSLQMQRLRMPSTSFSLAIVAQYAKAASIPSHRALTATFFC